jgi:hypothetical protein
MKGTINMKRKNTNNHYCVVCRIHTSGAGITSEDGVHICIECAEMIYNVMGQFHVMHLDNCACQHCRNGVMLAEEEYEW